MRKVTLSTTNLWFNIDEAIEISEGTWWNGSSTISKATGLQLEHESLFITKNGRLIIGSWSQTQRIKESYIEVNEEEAAKWLIKNEIFEIDDIRIDQKQKERIEQLIADAEI